MGKTREMQEAVRASESPHLGSVGPGDRVSLSSAGTPAGVVVEVFGGEAMVEFGNKRVRIRVESLYAAVPERDGGAAPGFDYRAEPLASTTLDVRGHEREEAVAEVTRFIDQAVYTGVREVKIIHGIGGGVLARAVRELLREDPRVGASRPGEQAEGGMGVTIVELAG
jgi:DNA mismatch repair protein MutS2